MKGELKLKEKLFNAFDGFLLAYKVPNILLKKMENDKKGTREGIFLKGLNLHFEENANFI